MYASCCPPIRESPCPAAAPPPAPPPQPSARPAAPEPVLSPQLDECEDLEEEAAAVIADFERGKNIELQHQVAFY